MRTHPASLGLAALLVAGAIVACSSTTTEVVHKPAPDPDAAAPPAEDAEPPPAKPFKLTSTAYEDGEVIPSDQGCVSHGGKSQLPPLEWGPGPEGTKSYAIIFRDDTLSFLHSVIYDIPLTANALPGNLAKVYAPPSPAGTKQTKNYLNTFGYAGPCAPSGTDTYEHVLHALDVETLPGGTMSLKLEDAETAIKEHSLKSTKLTGTYEKP